MAKATQYEFETLCRAILDAVGGSQNIANVFHCITRLRIVPVNRDLVDMDKLSSIKGILKVVESSGQIQCVIGTTVPEVYNDFIAISGINPGGEVKADAADTASDAAAVQEKKQNLIIRGLNTLAACVTPYLYAIVAGGMIKGIVSLITALGLAASDSDIITVLSAVGDAPFYFMPFMAGYAAAKRFRVKEVFGLMTAGILMYSTFSAPAEGVSSYAFGFIDIPAYNYKSSLFPVILSVWFFSVIFHFIDKRMPKNLRIVFSGALSLYQPLWIWLPLKKRRERLRARYSTKSARAYTQVRQILRGNWYVAVAAHTIFHLVVITSSRLVVGYGLTPARPSVP